MIDSRTAVRRAAGLGAVFAGALIAASAGAFAQTSPEIVWRVSNPFRLFTDAADAEMHRATYEALTDEEKRAPVLAAERALAERHTDGWAATMFRNICWNVEKNRYTCPEIKDYANPASHKIQARVADVPDAQGVDCTWLTTPLGGRQRGAAITVPCDTPVALEVPYPAGARVSVEVGGRQIAETTARIKDLLIVGFGDSFGSGEGNPDVPVRFSRERTADYGLRAKDQPLDNLPARIGDWSVIGDKAFIRENAQWTDQACHRSLYSHQLRAALQLAVEDPQRAVTYVGLACSGSETTFGLFLRYKGNEWVPNPPDASQISAAAQAQCGTVEAKSYDLPEAYHMNEKVPELKGGLVLRKCDADKARKIDLILLSIGGNDIGFSRLVANAVLADQSSLRSLGGWFGQVHGFKQAQALLDVLDDRYKSLNRAFHNILHVPWNESDRIILTAYPPMAVMEDGKAVCPDGQAGMTVLPDFMLSEAKAREGETAAARMQQIMKASAKAHGWTFAEAHRAAFQGARRLRGLVREFVQHGGRSAHPEKGRRQVGAVQPR